MKSNLRSQQKYLQHYSEAESHMVANMPHQCWDYCLLIPAYDESADFVKRLTQGLLSQLSVLLIVVINQPDSLAAPLDSNRALKEYIDQCGTLSWQNQHLSLIQLSPSLQPSPRPAASSISSSAILRVDRFSEQPIPVKQGVGLARKIIADIGLALIHQHYIRQPWLCCSDGDSTLPSDYFSALPHSSEHKSTEKLPPISAVLYPFHHRFELGETRNNPEKQALEKATQRYEKSLHHYVDGLKLAGSAYAFHTIGSTIAIHSSHYSLVRGFPKRAGAEDFYLLNKLAKTGDINSLKTPSLQLMPRQSSRVPFGTGPAVSKIMAMQHPETEFCSYHPQIFLELKAWLLLIPTLWSTPTAINNLSVTSQQLLKQLGVDKAINHSRKQSHSEAAFAKHMNIWFDSFLTMKFANGLQKMAFAAQPLI